VSRCARPTRGRDPWGWRDRAMKGGRGGPVRSLYSGLNYAPFTEDYNRHFPGSRDAVKLALTG
jgi:hypothetical protein